jgi:glycosyltransferase involved in cell wall biosynthesis
MKQCRVLYVARTARGGSAFSLYYLIKGLDRTRYEPVVLFYTQERPLIGDKLAILGVKVITLEKQHRVSSSALAEPVERRDIGGWLEARFGRWTCQVYVFLKACYQFVRWEASRVWPIVHTIRQNEINLVHLNTGLCHGTPGIIASWLTGTPCVCHVRMFDELSHFDRVFARFVDSFVYISRAVAENYITQGIPSAKGTVVHNAVDSTEFSIDFDKVSVRQEFGCTAQECLVGVVSRLDWWKGHEYFLEAVAEALQQIPNLKGLIIGEPETTPQNQEYFRMLQSLTKSLGLEDKVIFTGFRSDVPRLMSALDVVVLSSSAPEPFGRAVIEGMAAGKPVVATAAGGVLEIIEDGVNGLLVPCKDSSALAQAILLLLSDQGKAAQVGSVARQFVVKKFSLERHVAEVQSVYDSVMGVAKLPSAI